MIRCTIAFLFLAIGCLPQNVNYPKIFVVPKFVTKKIPLAENVDNIISHDMDFDGNDEILWIDKNKVYLSTTSMEKNYISIDEDIKQIKFFSNSTKFLIFSRDNIYYANEFKQNQIFLIAKTPTQNTAFLTPIMAKVNNDRIEDFFLLYQKNSQWYYDLYLWQKNNFYLFQSISSSDLPPFVIPQLSLYKGKKFQDIVLQTKTNILTFQLSGSEYKLVKNIKHPHPTSVQSIMANINNRSTVDIISTFTSSPQIKIQIDDIYNFDLYAPGILNIGLYLTDINSDGWQDVVTFSILDESPSILSYLFQGQISISCMVYEFINEQGTFSEQPTKIYPHKIWLSTYNKASQQQVLYTGDLDYDNFLDILLWQPDTGEVFIYYNAPHSEYKNHLPAYTKPIWHQVYKRIYSSKVLSPEGLPDAIISLPYVKEKILQVLTLKKSGNLHDRIALRTASEIILLEPY